MAFLVHILHLKKYQPVLRPALLAGLVGYCAVLALLVLDLGRPDRFYNFILFWNIHSPLFEISWCVLLYTTVLMIEVSPYLLERLNRPVLIGWVARIMAPVTILGVTLSTLHQSTLGTLYLNMPHRLDPLWYTPLLPLLFFVSSLMAGLSLGIIVYKGAVRLQSRPEDPEIVKGLGYGLVWVTLLYLLLKLGEMALAGEVSAFLALDAMSLLLLLELVAGAALPILLWLIPAIRNTQAAQWGLPALVLGGVLLNRFNATMFAQLLRPGIVYSPHILEWLSTIGILAGAGLVWGVGVCFLAQLEAKSKRARPSKGEL
jgi:Ni/Fe-hydrogenase subunit HybB-like protein